MDIYLFGVTGIVVEQTLQWHTDNQQDFVEHGWCSEE